MKLYSQAYSGTLVTIEELKHAKESLINRTPAELHGIIAAAHNQSARRTINQLKRAVGAKVSTPLHIAALSDLYQASYYEDAAGHPMPKRLPATPWEAAKLFALHRPFLAHLNSSQNGATSPGYSGQAAAVPGKPEGSQISSPKKSVQFSQVIEEIPAAPWRLSEKKLSTLTPVAVLRSEHKAAWLTRAQHTHVAKVESVDFLHGFAQLKFVI